ncbi:MAG: hypothetical protein KDH96_13275, partial [Candidatus Riesia sp.]|nr:hypothetical protein [Candidatus Riesia sp.]
YIPYQGGTTLVTPQYYTGDWVSLSDSTIPLSGNKVSIDLSSIPVSNYPIENASSGYLHNPIRFKIQQKSTNGTSLPPAIDYIEIYGDSTQYEIDLIPDWKISHSNARIKIQTVTGDHRTFKPHEELWSSMLLNTPTNTGVYLNTSLYTGIDSIPIDVVGYGEINRSGPYKSSFKNWTVSTLNAVAGSDAAGYFSTGSVYNVYPNPLFNNGFRPITSGEPNYYSGQVDGLIAQEVRIPSTYTGSHNILFDKQKVYRPKASSREKRIASYNGTAFDPTDNFSQKLKIYPGPTHDGTVGMEAYAPSGIATGYLQVTFDLQIQQGSGISVDLYGDITGTYNLPAEFFSEYRTV